MITTISARSTLAGTAGASAGPTAPAQAASYQNMLKGRRQPAARIVRTAGERIDRRCATNQGQDDRDDQRQRYSAIGWCASWLPINKNRQELASKAASVQTSSTCWRPATDIDPLGPTLPMINPAARATKTPDACANSRTRRPRVQRIVSRIVRMNECSETGRGHYAVDVRIWFKTVLYSAQRLHYRHGGLVQGSDASEVEAKRSRIPLSSLSWPYKAWPRPGTSIRSAAGNALMYRSAVAGGM